MGLEFKPYFAWEDEEHDRHVKQCGSDEKQTTTTNSSTPAESAQSDISDESLSSGGGGGYGNQEEEEEEQEQQQQQAPAPERNPNGGGLVFVHADGTPPAAPVAAPLNNNSNNAGGRGELSLALALAAVNGERREYAVLVASEEENVNEYKSFFSIVLDCPQFLGQGETKESALRQARTLLHYALGSSLLKNEAIPAPSFGAELEAKKVAMERDWLLVKLENFSMELVPLQFQPGIDYMARPPESDGEYESDREDEELFELESRMSTP